MNNMVTGRMEGVDAGRAFAALAVVMLHCSMGYLLGMEVFFNQAARFAVPYFFIISGYFWGRQLAAEKVSPFPLFAKSGLRIIRIYLIWLIIYILIPSDLDLIKDFGIKEALIQQVDSSYHGFIANPVRFFLSGGVFSGQLWFFPALILGQLVLALVVGSGLGNKAQYLIIPCYLFVLMTGSYADTCLGINQSFYSRNGPFFSSSFVLLGYFISVRDIRFSRFWIMALIFGGYLFQMMEGNWLFHYYGKLMLSNRALVGTFFFSAGVALLAIQANRSNHFGVLPFIGRYALGIYVVHILILRYGFGIGLLRLPVIKYFTPVIVYGVSLGVSVILKKWRLTRPIAA